MRPQGCQRHRRFGRQVGIRLHDHVVPLELRGQLPHVGVRRDAAEVDDDKAAREVRDLDLVRQGVAAVAVPGQLGHVWSRGGRVSGVGLVRVVDGVQNRRRLLVGRFAGAGRVDLIQAIQVERDEDGHHRQHVQPEAAAQTALALLALTALALLAFTALALTALARVRRAVPAACGAGLAAVLAAGAAAAARCHTGSPSGGVSRV